ncbi:MAG: hypothetical protein BRC26_01930 [Nanohaloarchaea archaeon QH_8_44_6]|nr:MAG: hypothetical protein BRC26_01930 [Nanohaloarchaea archaeon QH_8_44_6]
MLPELIYREEQHDNYLLLSASGLASGLFGFTIANLVLPENVSVLAVVFAAIPILYPLTRSFLEDEESGRPHLDEGLQYGSLFIGEVLAFFLLALLLAPENFSVQITQFAADLEMMGIQNLGGSSLTEITGMVAAEAQFMSILLHNLTVFTVILVVSALVSSSGAFILTWNASVLGVFMGVLAKKLDGLDVLTGAGDVPTPLLYIPHASFEMAGFIVAGITGSLISAAIYREHFDQDTWIDYGKLIALGAGLILVAAVLETA